MKTFEPSCQWLACPRRTGLRLWCARLAGLVRPGDKEPQIPRPREAGHARRDTGFRVPARSARAPSWARASRDRWARAVCICPRPRGCCGAHSQGGGAPVPLHPAVSQRPSHSGTGFHPRTGEAPINQGQPALQPSRTGEGGANLSRFPEPSQPPSRSHKRTFTAPSEIWAVCALLGQRESSKRADLQSLRAQVWYAVLSALGAYITTHAHMYAYVCILCVYVYIPSLLSTTLHLKMPFD